MIKIAERHRHGASVTRRDFIRTLSGITFTVGLGSVTSCDTGTNDVGPDAAASRQITLNAYVNVSPDGTVTIFTPSAEMGQGTMTALPLIVAEEMDVAWDDVRIMPSPAIGEVYGDPLFLNMIYSAASRAATIYFDRLRRFGAQGRMILMSNAASKLGVSIAELTTEPSKVIHAKTGTVLTYGEIAAFATFADEPPPINGLELKNPDEFRLIGKDMPRRDTPAKVTGQTQYSIDVELPGMLYAAVTRAPIEGAELLEVDDSSALASPGVVRVARNRQQVAVVAKNYHQALQARSRLRVKWSRVGIVNDYDSDQAIEVNARAAKDLSINGFPWDGGGSIGDGFEAADTIIEREYRTDYMYHACMEPLNAVVWVKDGGTAAEVWAGTQAPLYTVDAVARTVGIDRSAVVLHRSLLGGAFGRRSVYSMDFVTDAAWLSKELEQPIKVIWNREDDFSQGHFRSMTAQFLQAAIDKEGRIRAWRHRVACEDPLERYDPPLYEGWGKIPLISMLGSEHRGDDGSPIPYAYDLPNRLVEQIPVPAGIRVYAMRGVGAMPNTFAVECFVDELAEQMRMDPLEYRKSLLHRSPRAQHVLNTVAEMAGWGHSNENRGLGLAYSHYGHSLVACVVEVSADPGSGRVVPHNVWVVADIGIVIQPDTVRAQIEGGVLFGLSNALYEKITIKGGVPKNTNFHEYKIMKMSEAPEVSVELVSSTNPPTGIGEAGTVVVPAALANAFAALTGKRLRHMPFTEERVKGAML